MHGSRDDERKSAADLVTPRADEELTEGEANHRRGERQLNGSDRRVELGLDHGKGREVQVDRERAESGERAENENVDQPLAGGQGIARITTVVT